MKNKDTQVWFRVDTTTRATLERLAQQEQRTLSNMVRVLLDEALRARNNHPTPQQAGKESEQ